MILSKRSNGIYYVIYNQANGKRTRISTKSKMKVEALSFLSRFQKELDLRKNMKPVAVTLQVYCVKFLEYSKSVHTVLTHKGYDKTLSMLQEYLGKIALQEITPVMMSEYLEQRIKTSSVYQARKDLICINSLFNKAVAEDYIEVNPCRKIKRIKIPQRQPIFFSSEEFKCLLNKIQEEDFRDLITFAIYTGLRQMELITLQWSQVNFKDRYIILDNNANVTKSKRVRAIPLNIEALQILTHRERIEKTEYVFTYKSKKIKAEFLSKRFKKYVIKAKLNPKLKFHSLRHSFASLLVQKGVTIYEVSKLLGHADVKTTEIYSHLRAEDLRSAIDKLNN